MPWPPEPESAVPSIVQCIAVETYYDDFQVDPPDGESAVISGRRRWHIGIGRVVEGLGSVLSASVVKKRLMHLQTPATPAIPFWSTGGSFLFYGMGPGFSRYRA
jgi:hypothetical protein